MSRLTVRLFGAPAFAVGGSPWAFSAPPGCLALIAYLAVRTEPVARAVAAAALWPSDHDADARANLRRHVHRLRRALPDLGVEWIADGAGGLAWNHGAGEVDAATFLAAIGTPSRAPEAVELYRGDLLAGYDDEWVVVERERVRALYLEALSALCADARGRRDFTAAIGYAERLLAADDLREDALRHAVAARYESGDRSAALAAYDRFAARLRDELGVEPMAETIALRDAIAAGLPLHDPGAAFGVDAVARELPGMPFVGRRGELDALARAWTRAARGFGSTVLLAGSAGLGKSRLAAEFAAVAERQGGRVLVGPTAQPESAPYQALIAAAQRGLPALGRDGLDDVWAGALTGVLPELRAIRPDIRSPEPLDAGRARVRLHEALARYFETIARGRPLVLVLEDLHWAGRDTIDAIEALARRAVGAPLLVVATYRPDEGDAGNGLAALARTLLNERRASRTVLVPLLPEQIADLVARTPILERAPAELSTSVARLSEGNPLFAVQLLRSYEETRRVPDADGATITVSDAILARADRLGADVRAVADAASTVGRTFTVESVAAAGGWSEAVVQPAIDELLQRHLVYASTADGTTYAFAHALIATAIYAATPPASRVPRHRRIARLLHAYAGDDRALIASQARHYRLAGDREPAYDAYMRAAAAALGVFARGEASAHAHDAAELASGDAQTYAALELAVRAVDAVADLALRKAELDRLDAVVARLGERERFTVLEAWAMYYAHAGDAPQAHAATLEAMFDAARRSGDAAQLASAFDARAYAMMVGGNVAQAEAPLAEAAALAQRAGDAALYARLSIRLSHIRIRLGKADEALVVLARRRSELTPSSNPVEWIELLNAEINCAFVLEDFVLGANAGAELLAIAQRAGDVESEARAHGVLSYVAHANADTAGMREHSDLAIGALERIGHGRSLAVTLVNRGTLEFEVGRIEDALRFWERAETIGEHVSRDGVAVAALSRAEAELVRDRFQRAAEIGAHALACARETGEERHIAEALVILGAARSALGEHAAGVRDLREGIARRRAAGGARSLPHELAYLVEALVRSGDLVAAGAAADELAALDASGAKHPCRVHAVLASFRGAAGDGAGARREIEEGRRLLRARLATLSPPDARAYRALPFARELSARRPDLGAAAPR